MAGSFGLFSRSAKKRAFVKDSLGATTENTAYTQTYATAAATVPAATSSTVTDSSSGTAATITAQAVTIGAVNSSATAANGIATLNVELNLMKADILALAKLINQMIDDAQERGDAR